MYFLRSCLQQSNTHPGALNPPCPCCKNARGPGRRRRFFDAPLATTVLATLKLVNTSCSRCCWRWVVLLGVGVGGGWLPSSGLNPCAKPVGLIGTSSAMLYSRYLCSYRRSLVRHVFLQHICSIEQTRGPTARVPTGKNVHTYTKKPPTIPLAEVHPVGSNCRIDPSFLL